MYQAIKRIPGVKPFLRAYHQYKTYNVHGEFPNNMSLHNYGVTVPEDFWILKFIENKQLLVNKPYAKLSIFSVFGLKSMIRLDRSDIKIFFARENVHRENWKAYDDLCLKMPCIDLNIGFDLINEVRYIRFPLWIMWLFKPEVTYQELKEFTERVNNPNNSSFDGKKFCSFVSSHDDIGRLELVREISSVGVVDCDGKLFHNNDDLKQKFGDNKKEYLKNYRFNLCPENSNYPGYVTEKIFEAISSGCVPIYCGSNNNPEPEILNQEAICFVELGKKNPIAIETLSKLNCEKNQYLEFAQQPRLTQEAPDIIFDYILSLEKRLSAIINNV